MIQSQCHWAATLHNSFESCMQLLSTSKQASISALQEVRQSVTIKKKKERLLLSRNYKPKKTPNPKPPKEKNFSWRSWVHLVPTESLYLLWNWMALAVHVYSYVTFLSNLYTLWRGHLHNLKQSQAFVASSSRQELQSVPLPRWGNILPGVLRSLRWWSQSSVMRTQHGCYSSCASDSSRYLKWSLLLVQWIKWCLPIPVMPCEIYVDKELKGTCSLLLRDN